jgi:stress-induced morphogen
MIKAKADLKNQAKEIVDELNKEFENAEKARKDANILGGGTSDEENDNAAKLERYKAFLEQKLAMTQENTEAQKQLQQQLHDTEVQLADDSNKKQQQKIGERQQMMANMISTLGDGLSSFFNEQDKSFHNFLKSMLTSCLMRLRWQSRLTMHRCWHMSWQKSRGLALPVQQA